MDLAHQGVSFCGKGGNVFPFTGYSGLGLVDLYYRIEVALEVLIKFMLEARRNGRE